MLGHLPFPDVIFKQRQEWAIVCCVSQRNFSRWDSKNIVACFVCILNSPEHNVVAILWARMQHAAVLRGAFAALPQPAAADASAVDAAAAADAAGVAAEVAAPAPPPAVAVAFAALPGTS